MKNNKNYSSSEVLYFLCSYNYLGSITNSENIAIPEIYSPVRFNKERYKKIKNENNTKSNLVNCIHNRVSARIFSPQKISNKDIMKILFNSYSQKDEKGSFTIPQAGGLSVMSLNVLIMEGDTWSIYKYDHFNYEILKINKNEDNPSKFFFTKSVDFKNASCCIIISCNLNALSLQYLSRAFKFGCFHAGHICQNIVLTAASLGIKSVTLGSLIESNIIDACNLSKCQYPLYAVLLGT